MFNHRNIIINKTGRKDSDVSLPPDDNVLKLAAYYTRIFEDTLETMHLTSAQKSRAMSAVKMEYYEILSVSGSVGMVS